MDLQTLVVSLLVPACFLYAAWVLMPAALRRRFATWLLQFELPAPIARMLGRQASASSGCRCGGCDQSTGRAARPDAPVVRFHPRHKDGD